MHILNFIHFPRSQQFGKAAEAELERKQKLLATVKEVTLESIRKAGTKEQEQYMHRRM